MKFEYLNKLGEKRMTKNLKSNALLFSWHVWMVCYDIFNVKLIITSNFRLLQSAHFSLNLD